MPIITIPGPLREKLGDKGAESLVEVFREWERGTKEDVIALSGEKFEKRLTEEISKLDKRITGQVSESERRITGQVSELDRRITGQVSELDRRIAEQASRVDNRIIHVLERIDRNFRWTAGILFVTLIPMWVSIILVIISKG